MASGDSLPIEAAATALLLGVVATGPLRRRRAAVLLARPAGAHFRHNA